jgi:hypothetical protein
MTMNLRALYLYPKAYIYIVMAGISRTINALAGNDSRETISSHIGKKIRDGKSLTIGERVYYGVVNPFVGSDHWVKSIDNSVGGENAWKRMFETFV